MNSDDILSKCLTSGSYTFMNDSMLRGLDGDAYEAFILAKLITLFKMFHDSNILVNGYFYQTVDNFTFNCGISEAHQRSAIKSLVAKKLIFVTLLGSPPRRHFKLNPDSIIKLMEVRNKTKNTISKDEKKLNQIAFYEELNLRLSISFEATLNLSSNINKKILFFMYAWTYNTKVIWSSKDFGILRTYWRSRYLNKEFDYNVFIKFLESNRNKTIFDFIKFDLETAELAPALRISCYDYNVNGETMEMNND